MTFDSLEIDVDFIKGLEREPTLVSLSDSDLKLISKNPAKAILKSDLELHYNIINDSTKLDSIVAKHQKDLQIALAYLQLYLFFGSNVYKSFDYGVTKSNFYLSLYTSEKAKWNRFDVGFDYSQIISIQR